MAGKLWTFITRIKSGNQSYINKKYIFQKNFFNEILVKVAEHKYIYIAEIKSFKIYKKNNNSNNNNNNRTLVLKWWPK